MTHKPHIITEIYAWIATEADGGEGIPAMNVGNMMLPLIGADELRVAHINEMAKAFHDIGGGKIPMRLARFQLVEDNIDVLPARKSQ